MNVKSTEKNIYLMLLIKEELQEKEFSVCVDIRALPVQRWQCVHVWERISQTYQTCTSNSSCTEQDTRRINKEHTVIELFRHWTVHLHLADAFIQSNLQ